MSKAELLKRFDAVIGRPLVPLVRRLAGGRRGMPTDVPEVLFIRPGGIGDAVLLLPGISHVKRAFPGASIDVLCEGRNAGVFAMTTAVSRTYLYDRGIDLLRCLGNRYDVVIDTEQWHRLSGIVAAGTQAPIRLGFDTNNRGTLFTHKVAYSHDEYEAVSFANLIAPLTEQPLTFDHNAPFITLVEDIPGELSLSAGELNRVVSVFPGASVRERRWGGRNYGKVAGALSDMGYIPVIVGAGSDKADAVEISRHCDRCIDLTGKTTLVQSASVLKLSRVLISADSGLLHIAVGVGTPTVSLFGSGIQGKWAPPGKAHRVINAGLSCSPCTRFGYTHPCKIGVECLTSITPEKVTEAALQVLE
ncbi:glycosyl transferase family protein [Candidatus Magnetobacterium bavaricum]|uniref:Glycosyl transferase family protein n=1 Tax=Candidatus Magnetobacterium bavaricum TaxID=29290 RepID=A0A0F3GXG3_9BACT|nr:glycosyl transferase family protein [Candidatus Magnetobacterium bavaricum]